MWCFFSFCTYLFIIFAIMKVNKLALVLHSACSLLLCINVTPNNCPTSAFLCLSVIHFLSMFMFVWQKNHTFSFGLKSQWSSPLFLFNFTLDNLSVQFFLLQGSHMLSESNWHFQRTWWLTVTYILTISVQHCFQIYNYLLFVSICH